MTFILNMQVLLCGFGLPICGYVFGFLLAKLMRLSTSDVITISIETGVQNGSIAILMLAVALELPAGSMVTGECWPPGQIRFIF